MAEEELLVGVVVDVVDVVDVDEVEDEDAAPVLPLDPVVPESAVSAEVPFEELGVSVVAVEFDEEDVESPEARTAVAPGRS